MTVVANLRVGVALAMYSSCVIVFPLGEPPCGSAPTGHVSPSTAYHHITLQNRSPEEREQKNQYALILDRLQR